jgi:predicted O-methyltransferase YrrM
MTLAPHRPFLVTAEDLAPGDYVAPGLDIVRPDRCFPHMTLGDKQAHPWPYLRREIAHNWYVDARKPLMGFINRDEAALLYNIARRFAGRPALEVGCWLGWSTCHLALGGVELDVVDPILADPEHRASVDAALAGCGVADRVRLHAASSPEGVREAAARHPDGWSLFFIDGNHETPGPELDVEVCLEHAAPHCAFVFHDLVSPHVAEGLRQLEARGFNVLVYQTMQIMGFAWRGASGPVAHAPDPSVVWQLPHHLVGLPVSGVEMPGYPAGLRQRAGEQALALAEATNARDAWMALAEDRAQRNAALDAELRAFRGRRLVRWAAWLTSRR